MTSIFEYQIVAHHKNTELNPEKEPSFYIFFIRIWLRHDSIVSTATWLNDLNFKLWHRSVSCAKCPKWLWSPPSLLSNWYQGLCPWCYGNHTMNLTIAHSWIIFVTFCLVGSCSLYFGQDILYSAGSFCTCWHFTDSVKLWYIKCIRAQYPNSVTG